MLPPWLSATLIHMHTQQSKITLEFSVLKPKQHNGTGNWYETAKSVFGFLFFVCICIGIAQAIRILTMDVFYCQTVNVVFALCVVNCLIFIYA